MSSKLFWRAALVETLLVGGPFLLVLLLPLHGSPLTDWGPAIGPGVWILGSLATGRVLSLPLSLTIVSMLAGGIAGALIGVAVEHYGALPIAIGVFAACCSGYDEAAAAERRAAGIEPVAPPAERPPRSVSASLDDAA